MLTDEDRQVLLAIARGAIRARLAGLAYDLPAAGGALAVPAAAFVTLRRGGRLRGCIGRIEAIEPLARVVADAAVSAAFHDPRFPPLAPEELDDVDIEISVLGPLEPVADVTEIEVGRHGVVVADGLRRGLLLPQVATEWGWDRETLLRHACLKAGLAPTAWRDGAALYRFEAIVFGETAAA
ncbi:MAG TPA: AmmeMemoRadiSam system protein A [Vicinamibacterales bacterium]|nr:AmmeMemoRadiSam system protein A [Vicinamibacterales bacterium]